jgi:hypothetical protein
MGLIENMKRKLDEKEKTNEMTESGYSKNYINLLSSSVGVMKLRQTKFAGIIGHLNWNVDFGHGTIKFGDESYPISFIGSQSDINNTWMWGSNNINGFSDNVIRKIVNYVNKDEIKLTKEINKESFKMDSLISGHYLAGMFAHYEKACYYRCNYDGGAAFVLVEKLPQEVFKSASVEETVKVISELISELPLNHLLLVKGIFDANTISYRNLDNKKLIGFFGNYQKLEVDFDEYDRIVNMQTSKY